MNSLHLMHAYFMRNKPVHDKISFVYVQYRLLEERLVTAVKFDRQVGYHLPKHNPITCYMLTDFHSNDGACLTAKGIGSLQRFFLPRKKTAAVKKAMRD